MDIILLYGPPASGKTTIAKTIVDRSDFGYISVGQITRREISNNTTTGLKLKRYLDKIIEYPVGLITEIIDNEILSMQNKKVTKVLVDGFPKYPREVESFLSLRKKRLFNIKKIVVIDITYDELIHRIKFRKICRHCLKEYKVLNNVDSFCSICAGKLITREDDSLDVFKRRYGDYVLFLEKNLQILYHYCDKIVKINGRGTEKDVARRFLKVVKSL